MKAKKLKLPARVAKQLGVNVDSINQKLQKMVDKKQNQSLEEIIEGTNLIEDYKDFTREEILALLLDAAAEAGFLRFKMELLVKEGAVDEKRFMELMTRNISEDTDDIKDQLGFPKDFL